MRALLLVAIATLAGCSSFGPSEDWTKTDTRRQIAYSSALFLDAVTTARIHERPDLIEGNPITRAVLGVHPDPVETFVAAALSGFAHYLISRRMKPERRRIFQYGALAIHAEALHSNCENALC